MSWNTATVADGPHTLAAIATDTSGNHSTNSIAITVTNNLALNQRIQAVGAITVYQTASSTGAVTGTELNGAVGTIVTGPSFDGQNNWWQINFTNGVTGWVIAGSLQPLPILNTWAPLVARCSRSWKGVHDRGEGSGGWRLICRLSA
jgi:hypothetical protein